MATQVTSHDWPSGGRTMLSVKPECKYGFHEGTRLSPIGKLVLIYMPETLCRYVSANEPDLGPFEQNSMSNEEIPGHLPRGRACQACRCVRPSSTLIGLLISRTRPLYSNRKMVRMFVLLFVRRHLCNRLSEMRWQSAGLQPMRTVQEGERMHFCPWSSSL